MKWFGIILGVVVGTMAAFFLYGWLFTGVLQFQDSSGGAVLGSVFSASVSIICTIIILKKIGNSGK